MSDYQAVPLNPACSTLPSNVSVLKVETKQLEPRIEELKPLDRQKRSKKAKWAQVLGNDTWIWEIVSCAVGLITIVATFVILNHYNGHPIPIVLPNDVKLGSLLSVFSTIIKAAISLPLSAGLSQLVWSRFQRGHRPLIDFATYDNASRGVLGGVTLLWKRRASYISVLGVLCCISAFAIGPFIQGTLGSAFVTRVSTLPVCRSVDGSQFGTLFNQYQASIYLSDFNPKGPSDESLQGLNTNCMTGNCEWPKFSSLAVCSETTDLHDQVRQTFREADKSLQSLSLPNGLIISNLTDGNIVFSNGSKSLPTINYNDWKYPPIARFSILYYHYDFRNTGKAEFRAAEGIFYWCIQGYDAKVKDSILTSTVSSVWYPPFLNTSAPLQILAPPSEKLSSLGLDSPTEFSIIDQGSQFSFINSSLDNNAAKYDWPPNHIKAIAGLMVDDFPSFFTYLANALTNRLRGKLCNETAKGIMNQEPVLQVDWKWMILPTGTVLLVCVFLGAVIWESQRHDVRTWKNNILAVLFHGLSEDIKSERGFGREVDITTMQEKAKQVVVRLNEVQGEAGTALLLRP